MIKIDRPVAGSVPARRDVDIVNQGKRSVVLDLKVPEVVQAVLCAGHAGGSINLVIGILAALREARATGRGQVVDAAIVDGRAHLLVTIHQLLGSGRWQDRRGANLLDGGTPYYSVYETADIWRWEHWNRSSTRPYWQRWNARRR